MTEDVIWNTTLTMRRSHLGYETHHQFPSVNSLIYLIAITAKSGKTWDHI
ncbi:hypothetical protein SPLC1_S102330 [Arthrospira platensis C1]|nr:hypothetical protein SPLC1_S102330 [Arthrospira platensis C1]